MILWKTDEACVQARVPNIPERTRYTQEVYKMIRIMTDERAQTNLTTNSSLC
jgi:hypothetical protein